MRADNSWPVWVVEDNDNDFQLLADAWRHADLRHQLTRFKDGDALADRMRISEERTALILLDIKMPARDGHQLLSEIKRDCRFGKTPVVVLSTSGDNLDLERAYAAGATSYLVKPDAVSEMRELVRLIGAYWLRAVEYPNPQ